MHQGCAACTAAHQILNHYKAKLWTEQRAGINFENEFTWLKFFFIENLKLLVFLESKLSVKFIKAYRAFGW